MKPNRSPRVRKNNNSESPKHQSETLKTSHNVFLNRREAVRQATIENVTLIQQLDHSLSLSPQAALEFLSKLAVQSSHLRMACSWLERGLLLLSKIAERCPEAEKVLAEAFPESIDLSREERKEGEWQFVKGCDCLRHARSHLQRMISERTVGVILSSILEDLEELNWEDFRFLRTFISLTEAQKFRLDLGPAQLKGFKRTIEEGLSKEDYGLSAEAAMHAVGALLQAEIDVTDHGAGIY